jgi:hypothetical protein
MPTQFASQKRDVDPLLMGVSDGGLACHVKET